MLTIQQNWTREKQINKDDVTNNFPDLCLDYKDKCTKFPREFKGETFKAKAICAIEREIHYLKNEKEQHATVLDVTFLIRNPDDSKIYYFTGGIFSPKDYQSNDMHDFLMLAYAQKSNALEDAFTRKNFEKIETIYPHIAGCLFTISVATSGYRDGKDTQFEQYSWRCYSQDGRSQEEIENEQTEAVAINEDLEKLKVAFSKRHEQKTKKKAAAGNKTTNQYGAGTQKAQTVQTQKQKINSFTGMSETPVESSGLNDDLPF